MQSEATGACTALTHGRCRSHPILFNASSCPAPCVSLLQSPGACCDARASWLRQLVWRQGTATQCDTATLLNWRLRFCRGYDSPLDISMQMDRLLQDMPGIVLTPFSEALQKVFPASSCA